MKQRIDNFVRYLALSIFGWLVVGQLARLQLTPSIAIYPHDLVILVVLGWWGLVNQKLHRNYDFSSSFKGHRWWWIVGAWVLMGALWATVTQGAMLHWLYLGRVAAYLVFGLYLGQLKESPVIAGHRWRVLDGFLYAGGAFLVVAGLQYLLLPDTRFLAQFGWDDHYYRLLGTQFDPAYAGAILMVTFFLGYRLEAVRARVAFQLLTVIAIGLTFSRATYLAFALALLYFVGQSWWQAQQRWKELLYLVLLILVILLAPKPTGEGVNLSRTSTIVSRTTATTSIVENITPLEWVVGRGLFVPTTSMDRIRTDGDRADHAKLPDNLGVTIVTGVGVLGTLFIGRALWSERRVVIAYPAWLTAILIAVLVHSQFNNTLFQPFVLLLVSGVLFSVDRAARVGKKL